MVAGVAAAAAAVAAGVGIVTEDPGIHGSAEFRVTYSLDGGGTWQRRTVSLPQVACTSSGGELRYRASGAAPVEASATLTLDPPAGAVLVTLPNGLRFRGEHTFDANSDGFAFIVMDGELLEPGTDPDGPVITTAQAAGTLTCG